MGVRSRPLDQAQLDALRWVVDGCEGQADPAVKHRVNALATRRIVTVKRGKGGWQTAISDDGRHYLEHGTYPTPPELEESEASASSGSPSAEADRPRSPPRTPSLTLPEGLDDRLAKKSGPPAGSLFLCMIGRGSRSDRITQHVAGVIRQVDTGPTDRSSYRHLSDYSLIGLPCQPCSSNFRRRRDQSSSVDAREISLHAIRRSLETRSI